MSCRCRRVVVLLALWLGGCCAVGSTAPEHATAELTGSSSIIYVVRRAWHIDIGFASEDLSPPLRSLTHEFPRARYLLFGFGDRRYLHSSNRRLPNMLGALWPGPGLILLTALTGTPAQAFGARELIAVPVNGRQLHAAQAAVWATLAIRDGAMQSDGAGPYDGSAYLRASEGYSAIHTCNTWAAEVLKAAALPVHSRGVVFAWQLWGQIRRLSEPAGG
jgi:hypothetical protein